MTETEVRLIDANAMKSVKFIQSGDFNSIESFRAWIDSAPTVEAMPIRHGLWIKLSGWYNRGNVKCSECGNTLDMHGVNAGRGDANFCPNCGAKMDEGAK